MSTHLFSTSEPILTRLKKDLSRICSWSLTLTSQSRLKPKPLSKKNLPLWEYNLPLQGPRETLLEDKNWKLYLYTRQTTIAQFRTELQQFQDLSRCKFLQIPNRWISGLHPAGLHYIVLPVVSSLPLIKSNSLVIGKNPHLF